MTKAKLSDISCWNGKQESIFESAVWTPSEANELKSPRGYSNWSAFHKYWGKKPTECLAFVIEQLSNRGDIVVDPFMGSGLVARETVLRGRRFIGIDINPISIELARFYLQPPPLDSVTKVMKQLQRDVKPAIQNTYRTRTGDVASHYLWEGEEMKSVWVISNDRQRKELPPSEWDIGLAFQYDDCTSRFIRPIQFFENPRINSSPTMNLSSLFTGRALHNIDLLLEHINPLPDSVRRAFMLALTSASGQMSKMVFAISQRGKTNGSTSDRIEVGSWVIGFWRPKLHFEINVWNCFWNRYRRLLKCLSNDQIQGRAHICNTVDHIMDAKGNCTLLVNDANDALAGMPDKCLPLVVADPPHDDRIPYLELSEIWNAIMGFRPQFDKEIVISNAKERGKTHGIYIQEIRRFFNQVSRVLVDGGFLAYFYNSRDEESWQHIRDNLCAGTRLKYRGCFPMEYSAHSVVQDNRDGALKNDYVLIYQKVSESGIENRGLGRIEKLECWSRDHPVRVRS